MAATPSYNRMILAGLVGSSRLYSYADGRMVFRFVLSTRRLTLDDKGERYLGWDNHYCQISGPRQAEKAMRQIRKGAWLHLEGSVRCSEKNRNTPEYSRRVTVIVEYWQLLKDGDDSSQPKVYEWDAVDLPGADKVLEAQDKWDSTLDNKASGTDSRDTRG